VLGAFSHGHGRNIGDGIAHPPKLKHKHQRSPALSRSSIRVIRVHQGHTSALRIKRRQAAERRDQRRADCGSYCAVNTKRPSRTEAAVFSTTT